MLPDQKHTGTGSFGNSLHAAHLVGIKERGTNVIRADVMG